eukprot:CAMPEP_0181170490 /NCGR_PEP_ID=MMETSP1096-20121128/1393_1 /TAXON_ID=156174 ORGANISM="Chrysochromulina ericina, Strain CCMP281" /NCGR_SAMPLE_ID=MMETSP1096 /ASSEMBLY_ACC=CAM_ASM_000453 /LENGTH=75 /DNA_ID=CAMNT_0023258053 /DNA_START=189 /DNA_END=416 /DNA_ORIENTATION=-
MYLPARCSSLTGIVRARPVVALPAGLALEARLLLPGARDLEELVDLLWISCHISRHTEEPARLHACGDLADHVGT